MLTRIRQIWHEVLGTFFVKYRRFRLISCEDTPEKLEACVLYVIGIPPHEWSVAMLCPCGCQAIIQLNLLKQTRPCWELIHNRDGSVSLSPSVWRQTGCRSHFFLKHSHIEWCK